MLMVLLILVPVAGGVLCLAAGERRREFVRGLALLTMLVECGLVVTLWLSASGQGRWLAELDLPWFSSLGVRFHLALDGLSALMVALTALLGLLSVLAGWAEIRDRVAFYHLNLLWVLAGIMGVFLSLDLFLFYFFWELMLVPMYLLIAIWGHENRTYASIKFFLFTQAGGLLMLVSILGLALLHRQATGSLSFSYTDLLALDVPPSLRMWLMLGFFAAFAVKLPALPVHTWLPDAHTEAPTAGSVILAGLLLKTGAYGLLRFAVPLFPRASQEWAPVAVILGVAGIIYGAVLAFGQRDLKRLVAYTSISHLGFVLLGIYSFNQLALQGSIFQMIAHGLSTGGLFVLVGMVQERTETRDLGRLGGLWETLPRMGGVATVLAMASLGLPGLANFIAEFLILIGAWSVWPGWTILATFGLVLAAVYSLWLVQAAFQGPNERSRRLVDIQPREWFMMAVLILALVWLGLGPQPALDAARPVAEQLAPLALGGGGAALLP
jgi:NADH-quinone oxidoreductase subunit M